MVDNVNPNSQFHPYQPVNDTPAVERMKNALPAGLGDTLNSSLGKVREYARAKPGVVLGGLAALAIGAGLMRRRT
jgi:hypothetical protein